MTGYFTLMALVIGAVYYATYTVDYIWRWQNVPRYFFYQKEITIHAEDDGEVKRIIQNGDDVTIVISEDDGGDKTFVVPSSACEVDEGDMISVGDLIAEYKGDWAPGILSIGLWVTLKISIISTIIGIIIGILGGVARVSDTPVLKWTAITYVEPELAI